MIGLRIKHQMTTQPKKTPVTVTRGSNTGFFSQKADWIEGTFKSGVPVTLPPTLTQNFVETRAYNGYSVGSLYEDGRVVMINPARPEMGVHITWDGDACGRCPIEPTKLIEWLLNAKFTFTRIDIAIDLINCSVVPERATEEIYNGRCKTRAQQFPFWADAKNRGYTQYIGKKASESYCRIYDKAAEMGIQQDHTRVELVVRHTKAQAAASAIARGEDYRGLVVSFADFKEWREWRAAFQVPEVKLPSERKPTNTEMWLLKSVAPALARVIVLADSTEFYEKFKDAVMQYCIQMSNNRQTA